VQQRDSSGKGELDIYESHGKDNVN